MTWQVLLRRLRSPAVLAVPVVGFLLVEHELRTGLPAGWYPLAVAGFAALALPAAVALNPLADEGVGLPLVLASGLGGRAFVAGYAAAAALSAWLGTAAALLAAGVLFGVRPVTAAAALVAVVPLTLVTAPVAVAAGTALPRNDAHETAASEGVGFPSKYAIAVYTLVVAVVAAPFAVAAAFAPGTLLALGAAGSLLLGVVAAAVGSRVAASRFESFVLD
jgi:hypothetical protein